MLFLSSPIRRPCVRTSRGINRTRASPLDVSPVLVARPFGPPTGQRGDPCLDSMLALLAYWPISFVAPLLVRLRREGQVSRRLHWQLLTSGSVFGLTASLRLWDGAIHGLLRDSLLLSTGYPCNDSRMMGVRSRSIVLGFPAV